MVSTLIGKQAVVIGAGMGGLTAAGASPTASISFCKIEVLFDQNEKRAPEPGVETQRQDAQFFLPCTQSLSICSAMARSSSDAFAIARL